MTAKTYKQILQVGIFLSLGVIFLVFSKLLFPFITSKQISFNILMELMFPIWLVLIWKYPQFRPFKSLVSYGLVAYLLVILISCFTGVDFNLSFWGDAERMLGLFHITHFFLFYLYLITAFRDRKDWDILFILSVFLAFTQAIIVLFQDRRGFIGNTAYVSAYYIFNIFFSLILINRHRIRLHWPLYLALVLMFFAFFKANTSGAIIGLATSFLLLLFMLGIFASKKKIRRLSLSVFILIFLGAIILFSQYNQTWFKENRILSNLSSNKATFQTRRLSWEGAARDFKYHPWLGVGYGNYAFIFDRQFDPSFFNYSTTETYFDRAHNNLIDIVSTTGVLGLLAYLSIFIFVILEWIKLFKEEGCRVQAGQSGKRARELLILIALLVAYFVQNLAVFDSFATYMGLMIVLAYIVFLRHKNKASDSKAESIGSGSELFILISSFIVILIIMFNFNIRPLKTMKGSIKGYSMISRGQVEPGFEVFNETFTRETVLDRDAREALIKLIINNPNLLFQLGGPDKIEIALDYLISLAERNLDYNQADSLMLLQTAQIYDLAARYNYGDTDKFREYSNRAVLAVKRSIKSSPKRVQGFLTLGQIQAKAGKYDLAETAFLNAVELNPSFMGAQCQLASFYFIKEDQRYLERGSICLKGGDTGLSPEILLAMINDDGVNSDPELMLFAYRALARKANQTPEVYLELARLEIQAGNLEAAINAAIIASDIDETLKPEVERFIEELKKLSARE